MAKSTTATKADLRELGDEILDATQKAIAKSSDEILDVLHGFMRHVDTRFTNLEERFSKLENDVRQIYSLLDKISKDIEIGEQERKVLGMQLDRVDTWVHDLAEHIGYKLSPH